MFVHAYPFLFCLPEGVVDALLIAVLIVITGAMHLDALADTADGIFSGKERTVKLEIMKDSSVGAMGMVTVFIVLMLKYVTLIALSAALKNKALLLMPLMGRWAQVIVAYCSDYGGLSKGLGFPFTTHVSFTLLSFTGSLQRGGCLLPVVTAGDCNCCRHSPNCPVVQFIF